MHMHVCVCVQETRIWRVGGPQKFPGTRDRERYAFFALFGRLVIALIIVLVYGRHAAAGCE